MLIKALKILKNNPMLLILLLLALLVSSAVMLLLMPEIRDSLQISKGIAENPAITSADFSQTVRMLLSLLKIYIALFVLGILGLVFMSGYGNMLAAAVNEGKASLRVFRYGIGRLFGKVFLSALLLVALSMGVGIIISAAAVPITIAGITAGSTSYESMLHMQQVIQIVTQIIMLFLYPVIELWLPAVFLERNDGVFACFKKGFKASLKNYLPLLALTVVVMLPQIIMYAVAGDIYSILDSPVYLLTFVYQAIVSPVLLAVLFVIYFERGSSQYQKQA